MVINVLGLTRKGLVKWLKTSLEQYGIKLSRRLSQVVLVEPKAYKTILEAASTVLADVSNRLVVEIGAGPGTLTSILGGIENVYVVAVELDKRFSPILKEIQDSNHNVDIVIGDARKILGAIRSIYMVAGNLPYHITSDLILAIGRSRAEYALVTVQKDVAERLIAKPGTRNYGKISLFTQYLFDIETIADFPPSFFAPQPEVYSTVVLLKRKRTYESYMLVEDLIKCMYSFRRKHVLKSLRKCLDKKISLDEIDRSDELWMKRVYQIAPEDIERLAIFLAKIGYSQNSLKE
uniref:Ribosomal RNA small subunit methyltransferase A n=1 Tax=Ignisphaera aggregans TaxID=334771 RepID=A0A7C2V9L9_9CREN